MNTYLCGSLAFARRVIRVSLWRLFSVACSSPVEMFVRRLVSGMEGMRANVIVMDTQGVVAQKTTAFRQGDPQGEYAHSHYFGY